MLFRSIPFCLVPLLSTVIAYFATSLHFVSPTYISIPWVTPPLISGYLATAGDIRGSIVQFIIIVLGVLVYMPFVIFSNKLAQKEMVATED